MNCKPIYHKKTEAFRIIYAANGRWQAQRFVDRVEQMRKVDDGWHPIGRPTTQDIAMQKMKAAAAT